MRAPVGDDLRAAGGDVSIESSIGGEVHAAGGNITLTRTAQVAQGATLYGGNVVVDGKVAGSLKASAQKIVLNGEVGGDARLIGEQVELGPQARIAGALSYAAAGELKKAEGATIGGAVTRDERRTDKAMRERHREMHFEGPGWIGSVFAFLGLLACAAVFLLVFPVFSAQAQEGVGTSPWLALAVGFGTLLGVPVLAVLLMITLLGIPLGIAVFALYPVLLLVGYVVGVLFIARRAQRAMRPAAPESFAVRIGFFALALLLVMLLSRLPFVGALVLFLVTLAGIGACVLELYRRRQAPQARAAPGV
jgi:cytoskeletal protein CcmA (bactofilin family)